MSPPVQAVIFCGGRGERLRPLTDNLPKPMAPVLGRPFLEFLVAQLRDAGITRLVLLNGYKGEMIERHFGNGERFGVSILCLQQPAEWDTGRRLAEAASALDERFVLLYADNLAPFCLEALWEQHRRLGLPLTVTLAAKATGNIRLAPSGAVDLYDSSRTQSGLTHVEIGYMLVERQPMLAMNPARGSFSTVLKELAASQRLGAYSPGCSYNSIADLQRLRKTEQVLRPRRLLLIDRDGVINRKAARGEYVGSREQFEWIPQTLAGLQRLAGEGFEFIILSNQAGIGRGILKAEDVAALNQWMVGELAGHGVRIADVFVCPHHWEDGCACRKPRPGLFFQASDKHQFWTGHAVYVGDDPRDAVAAKNAGCLCTLIGDEAHSNGASESSALHFPAPELNSAIPWILDQYRKWEMKAECPETPL